MAATAEPVCAQCKVTSSLMWEKNKEGEVLCLECHSNSRQELPASGGAGNSSRSDRPSVAHSPPASSSLSNNRDSSAPPSADQSPSSCGSATANLPTGRRTRLRNARGRYGKTPANAAKNSHAVPTPSSPAASQSHSASNSASASQPPSTTAPSGTSSDLSSSSSSFAGSSHPHRRPVAVGRRSLAKGTKLKKAPTFEANIVTSDTVLHKGTRYEVGDIVSILDENGHVYYALLRGFLEDQYAEKYAALTWLVPTTPNPKAFDPSLFILGPEEDSPRDMECLDFVTRSPQSASFLPSLSRDSELARLWSGSKRRRIMFTS